MVLSGSKIFSEFDEDSIKSYNEKSKEENFLEVGIQYPEELHELHKDLPFLLEIPKTETLEKLAANLHDKNKCYSHEKFDTSIKSWISFEEISKSN